MDSRKYFVILLVLSCIAMFVAGCTTTTTIGNPATAPAATPAAAAATNAAHVPVPAAPAASAAPIVSTTPQCPASIWGGKWGTKWNSYENGDTIVDLWSGADNWDGYVTTPVTMTQNCWGVTGTIAFQPDCIGTITSGTIDKNDPNHLTGGWVTTGCQAEDQGYTGQFSVNMDNNKRGWIGKLISVNDPFADRDYQNNWAGKPA
jgi:hypothetical protein